MSFFFKKSPCSSHAPSPSPSRAPEPTSTPIASATPTPVATPSSHSTAQQPGTPYFSYSSPVRPHSAAPSPSFSQWGKGTVAGEDGAGAGTRASRNSSRAPSPTLSVKERIVYALAAATGTPLYRDTKDGSENNNDDDPDEADGFSAVLGGAPAQAPLGVWTGASCPARTRGAETSDLRADALEEETMRLLRGGPVRGWGASLSQNQSQTPTRPGISNGGTGGSIGGRTEKLDTVLNFEARASARRIVLLMPGPEEVDGLDGFQLTSGTSPVAEEDGFLGFERGVRPGRLLMRAGSVAGGDGAGTQTRRQEAEKENRGEKERGLKARKKRGPDEATKVVVDQRQRQEADASDDDGTTNSPTASSDSSESSIVVIHPPTPSASPTPMFTMGGRVAAVPWAPGLFMPPPPPPPSSSSSSSSSHSDDEKGGGEDGEDEGKNKEKKKLGFGTRSRGTKSEESALPRKWCGNKEDKEVI